MFYFLPCNPIYAGISAMVSVAVATTCCRLGLKSNTLVDGMQFLALYMVLLLGLKGTTPVFIEQIWNQPALSGVIIYGLPLEEPMFGLSFGLVWTGINEYIN